MRIFQCAVMGAGGVGKSAVTVRFINGSYLEWYDPTIEDSYRKQFSVDSTPCLLEILDTAGVEQYLTLNDLFIRESQGFILVFSDSFQELVGLRERIFSVKGVPERVPLVLVGNKSDMMDERQVDREEAEKLAEKWGIKYLETSAASLPLRTDTNIAGVFEEIVRQMRKFDTGKREKRPRWRPKENKCVLM